MGWGAVVAFGGGGGPVAGAGGYGLRDGIPDLRGQVRALCGSKAKLRSIPLGPTGLLARCRRLPGLEAVTGNGFALPASLADDVVSAVETRSLWSRFGL